MVQHEIECKAHVSKQNFFNLQKILEHICIKKELVHKRDTYYMFPHDVSIRLRESKGELYIVSFKEKCIEDGIEKNIEYETQVQDAKVIDTIFTHLRPQTYIKKEKKGFSYIVEREGISITVELIEVQGLGYFIEMEYNEALSSQSPVINASSVKRILLNILSELHIEKEAIEPQYYIDMLQKKNGSHTTPINTIDY